MRLLIVLLIGVAFYVVQSLVYKKYWHKGFDVTIDFKENVVREGDRNTLIEVVKNDKWLSLPAIQVKFSITRSFIFKKESNSSVTDLYYRNEYFSCRPFQKITRKYDFTASKRGDFNISSVDIICKDIFLNRNMFADAKRQVGVLVLPYRIPMNEIPEDAIRMTGDIIHRIRLEEDPFEFNSVREYQPYDPIKYINWKATARNDDMYVNTFNTTNRKNVNVLLNIDVNTNRYKDDIAEGAIRIASCLCDHFISAHVPCALYSNAIDYETKEFVNIESGCDEAHIRNIDMALARIDSSVQSNPFDTVIEDNVVKSKDYNEFVIVSNLVKSSFYDKFDALRKDGYKVKLIVPIMNQSSTGQLGDNDPDIVFWNVNYER